MPNGGGKFLDVSSRVLLRLDGQDSVDLLQRISTNHLTGLKPGEHRQTILTNEKGRIVDLVTVFRNTETSFLVAAQSTDQKRLAEWINKYIVMEDVSVTPILQGWFQLLLYDFNFALLNSFIISNSIKLIKQEYTAGSVGLVVGEQRDLASVERELVTMGLSVDTSSGWEEFRTVRGFPTFPNELNDRFNPLEVGLRNLISFTKGCYIGQEVIARMDTYEKVRKGLQVLGLSALPGELPTELKNAAGETIGTLTSCERPNGVEHPLRGMGIVRLDAIGEEMSYSSAHRDSIGKAIAFENKDVNSV